MFSLGIPDVQPWCFRCSIQVFQISNTRVPGVIHLWIKHTKQSYDTYSFSPFRNLFVSSLFLQLLPVFLRHCKSDVLEVIIVFILDVQLALKSLILCWGLGKYILMVQPGWPTNAISREGNVYPSGSSQFVYVFSGFFQLNLNVSA